MKCKKINVKLLIGLLVLLGVIVITINYRKINETFNIFKDDSSVKNEMDKHNLFIKNKQQQENQTLLELEKQNKVNSTKDTIYELRQRILLLKQLFK